MPNHRFRMLLRHSLALLSLSLASQSEAFELATGYAQLGNNPAAVEKETRRYLAENASQPAKQQLAARLLLVQAMLRSGNDQGVENHIQWGINTARSANDNISLCRFLLARARFQLRTGKTEPSETWREINQLSGTLNNPLLLADVYAAKADWLAAQGLQQEALERAIYAYRAYEQQGQKHQLAGLLLQIASIQMQQGDLQDAFYYLSQARELRHEGEVDYLNLELEYLSGLATRKQGQLAGAEQQQLRALALAEKLDHKPYLARVQYELGQVKLGQSRLLDAERYLQLAEQSSRKSNEHSLRLHCTLALADLHTRLRDPQALQHLQQAEQYAQLLNTDPESAAYENQAATTLAEFGRWSEAYRHLRNYARLLQAMTDTKASATRSELQAQFQSQHKEAENALLRNQQKLKDVQLLQQRAEQQQLILALMLAFILVGAIVVALALLIRQRHQLRIMALKDELTDAPNRRSILAYASQQLKRCRRKQQTLMIALLDLDFFKQINDNYGHHAGDLVLRAFAEAIQSQLRGADRIGRIGGEEWLLVLPGLKPQIIQPFFERLQTEVKRIRVAGVPETRLITFSMGVTSISSHDKTLDETIARADEALYQAKNKGRDQMQMIWRNEPVS